jgi:hypothetical protein
MEGPTAIDHRVDRQRHETPAAKTFNPRPPRRPRSSRSCIHSHVLRGGVRSAIVGIATHLRRTNHLRLWLPFCTAFLPKLGPSQMAAFSCAPRVLCPTSGRNLVSTPAHEAISQPRIDLAKKTPPHLRDKARFSSGRLSPSRPGQSRLASERGEIGAQVHFKDGRPRNPARRLTMKHALMSAADTV